MYVTLQVFKKHFRQFFLLSDLYDVTERGSLSTNQKNVGLKVVGVKATWFVSKYQANKDHSEP